MNGNELVRFLNTLKEFVPGYWKGRIENVIKQMGGTVK
jgi:hypothetical protein